jgi:hypothetical protein
VPRKKNAAAVALGRLGGNARAKKLSKEQLSSGGRKAALARWSKAKAESGSQDGDARLKTITAEEHKAIARKGGTASGEGTRSKTKAQAGRNNVGRH